MSIQATNSIRTLLLLGAKCCTITMAPTIHRTVAPGCHTRTQLNHRYCPFLEKRSSPRLGASQNYARRPSRTPTPSLTRDRTTTSSQSSSPSVTPLQSRQPRPSAGTPSKRQKVAMPTPAGTAMLTVAYDAALLDVPDEEEEWQSVEDPFESLHLLVISI